MPLRLGIFSLCLGALGVGLIFAAVPLGSLWIRIFGIASVLLSVGFGFLAIGWAWGRAATLGSILRKLPFLAYLVLVGITACVAFVLDHGGYFTFIATLIAACPWSILLMGFDLGPSDLAFYAISWGGVVFNLVVLAYLGWKKTNRVPSAT